MEELHICEAAQPFWQTLTEDQRRRFAAGLRTQTYRRDGLVAGAGSDCLGVVFVRSGVLRISLLSVEGREAVISRIPAGEACLLTASCRIPAVTFDVQVQAETDCEADVLPAGLFGALMRENLRLENLVYRLMTERFSDVVNALQRMYFMTLRQRVASFLVGETARTGSPELSLTQERLAQAIGSAREAVNRCLKQMEKDGLVRLERGGLTVLDEGALRAEK